MPALGLGIAARLYAEVMQVGECDEQQLLDLILPRLPLGKCTLVGPGDDAAVLTGSDRHLVVTTDVLVQDRHFRLGWGTGADVGWRAAMQNLADVAAMGAHPTSLVVALVLRADVPVAWVSDLADGFAQACGPLDVGVVGGDLSSGEQVTVAVTAHGLLDGEPVLRAGAKPGDVLAVCGHLGRARAGWQLLQDGDARRPGDQDPGRDELVTAFLRPAPPLGAGPRAAAAGARAMMDVSDGLVRDASRMARASSVVIDVDSGALRPDLEALAAITDADTARAWVLGGGEDHALLAAFPGSQLPPGFRAIGRIASGEPAVLLDGAAVAPSGWDHFSDSATKPM